MTTAQAAAHELFGYERLHPAQARAIAALLGGHDVLLVSPTGSGKSLAYQLSGALTDGCTVVVSPLLALQADQLRRLPDDARTRGARISSFESGAQIDEALASAQ